MVRKITINDLASFNNLGKKLNKNFENVFELSKLLKEDYNKIYVYEINGEVIGFAHYTVSFSESDLVNIIIMEKYRHKGYGKILINEILKDKNIKEINIEVHENNKNAIKFYEKLGFKNIRIIKNYYEDGDAIFMKLVVNNE